MKIRTKFLLSSITAVVVLLVLVGIGEFGLRRGENDAEKVFQETSDLIVAVERTQFAWLDTIDEIHEVLFFIEDIDTESFEEFFNGVDEYNGNLDVLIADTLKEFPDASELDTLKEKRDLLNMEIDALRVTFTEIEPLISPDMSLDTADDIFDILVVSIEPIDILGEDIGSILEDLIDKAIEAEDVAFALLEAAERRAEIFSFAILVIIPLVFFAQFFFILRPSIRAIQRLEVGAEAIGAGDLDYQMDIRTRDEIEQLAQQFNKMATNLGVSYRSLEAEKATSEEYSHALQSELDKGRQLQQDFLPVRLPQPTGWELEAYLSPARDVSGDFFDAFALPNGRVGLVIADVCDKGVGSALFMALSRSLLRVFSGQIHLDGVEVSGNAGQDDTSTRDLIYALSAVGLTNNYIARTHSETNMFATLFFGILDPATGAVAYVNAGHEALAIVGPEGVTQRLGPTGPAVGVIPNAIFGIERVDIIPGSTLFGYTDGVPDARNVEGTSYSEERMIDLLKEPGSTAAATLNRVKDSVLAHIGTASQFDDITLLTVRREQPAA